MLKPTVVDLWRNWALGLESHVVQAGQCGRSLDRSQIYLYTSWVKLVS
jgi:hypothetical protein